MKSKAIIPLVLGLGMGLLAIKFGMDTLNKAKAAPVDLPTRPVVRATADIAESLAITPATRAAVDTAAAATTRSM